MSGFTQRSRALFNDLSADLFRSLSPGEGLTFGFRAEDTLFVRFNGNRVRQNTAVEQLVLSLQLQSGGRTTNASRTLTGRLEADLPLARELLARARAEARELPEDPNQVPISNNGESAEEFRGSLPSPAEVVEGVATVAEGSDLAGLYTGGSMVSGNRNSAGQSHWFATETFSLDYSLYDGPKAAKGCYAGTSWSRDDWARDFRRTREQLALLSKPQVNVKPGQHRAYLAPAAFAELMGMMSWGALSASWWKQGLSPFKKLADGEARLSPLLSLGENFALGLAPRFNGLGEVAPASVPLIVQGELKQLLTSSRSAKEFGLKGNAASEGEGPRVLDVSPGSLDERNALRELGTGLYLSNLHYLNWSDRVSARVTGMTRYACFWVEGGEVVGPIKDLRFDESLYDALGSKLQALTAQAEIQPETGTYGGRQFGGMRVPGALIDGFTFTL